MMLKVEVTIVGKIELQGYSESAIDKLVTRKFNHFSEQLFGRYGITITKDEYVFLSTLWPRKKKKSNKGNAVIGILTIKDTEVEVVKSIHPPRLLLTALPMKWDKDQKKKFAAFKRHEAKLNS